MFNSNLSPNSAHVQDIRLRNLSDLEFDLSRSLKVKYANDPEMTVNAKRPNVPYICWTTTHESQISPCFALRSLVLQIIEVFYFSIGYNGDLEIFETQWLKIGNAKPQKSGTYFCDEHCEENSGCCLNFRLRFVRGVAFWNFCSLTIPC